MTNKQNLQFVSVNFGTKRFLKTQPLPDFRNWLSDLASLKVLIEEETAFQIVGEKIYFEVSALKPVPALMLSVIGLPRGLEKKPLILCDLSYESVLVYRFQNKDIFEADPEQLLRESLELRGTLQAKLDQDGGKLADIFHIVFDYDKIELHFFRQKDYIQKQFSF